MTTNVVNLTQSAALKNHSNCLTVIINVEPISNVKSITINRKRLVLQAILNHQRNELLGELIRTIVVRTACNYRWESVCIMPGLYKHICRSFRCRVRAVWTQRCGLAEKCLWIIKRQRAIDLISRNLQISVVAIGALTIIPERLCNTQKSNSTHNVSVSKGAWIFNRTVYVALCSKVNNVIRMMSLKQLR